MVKLVVYRPQFGNNFNIIPLYIGLSNGDRFARVSAGNKLPPNTFRSFAFKCTPRSGKISNPFVHLIAPSRCSLLHAHNFPVCQPPSHNQCLLPLRRAGQRPKVRTSQPPMITLSLLLGLPFLERRLNKIPMSFGAMWL